MPTIERHLPQPGASVRGSRRGLPVMALLDLLGRRWALRILWELRNGALSFRALQDSAGGLSPSILNVRLKELRATGIVVATPSGYALSKAGDELLRRLAPVTAWASEWAAALGRSRAAAERAASTKAVAGSRKSATRPRPKGR